MVSNILSETWTNLDSFELRLLLAERVGGVGQYDEHPDNPKKLYLPLGGSSCRIGLIFRDKKIFAIEPGPAFDAAEWERIREEIEKSLLAGPLIVGRGYCFSSFRVLGSWRGDRSGVQILPPLDNAPRAHVEMADHPFILEFPMKGSDFWRITNYRRQKEHRNLTLLLNVLLAGRTSLQLRRSNHFWASVPHDNDHYEIKWVQQSYFAKLDKAVIDELSPSTGERLEKIEPDDYYTKVGHDGKGLRVPADLDQSIYLYQQLSATNRAKFNRATFWMDMASRQWHTSVSASFAALVSAIESLTERGNTHEFKCPVCDKHTQHEIPGATRRFKDFFGTYAPGTDLAKRRDDMYKLRSDILHGSELMQLDQDLDFGLDPPWRNELKLHEELWGLTRVALRNWLKNPPAT